MKTPFILYPTQKYLSIKFCVCFNHLKLIRIRDQIKYIINYLEEKNELLTLILIFGSYIRLGGAVICIVPPDWKMANITPIFRNVVRLMQGNWVMYILNYFRNQS